MINISVLIATKNEEVNLGRCLQSVRDAREIVVVDSASTDATAEIAARFGARVVGYRQDGDWPKKRQWALENLEFAAPWILILDADESVPSDLLSEIRTAIAADEADGYRIRLNLVFMGRVLRHGGNSLWKTPLFRRGLGGYERRLAGADSSGCDMEVHEHLVVRGRTTSLRARILHHDHRSLSEYIERHNRYSTWDALVFETSGEGRKPLFRCRSSVEVRRWAKRRILSSWWLWLVLFAYKYTVQMGFRDGSAGLAYCWLQSIQVLHTKVKIEFNRRAAGISQ